MFESNWQSFQDGHEPWKEQMQKKKKLFQKNAICAGNKFHTVPRESSKKSKLKAHYGVFLAYKQRSEAVYMFVH